ncbi:Imm39 family immunity protein [Halopseudomonas sabulinigri]|uniref:Uncharacterized protein n=1 Tax=Halopseudomonas sabulinigri TaxID=472181 RepID=A0ABP9ZL26_9GAMM
MPQGYILLVGSVDLVRARHKNSAKVSLRVRNEINARLISLGWPEKAPFDHVSLIIRYGEVAVEDVEIGPISRGTRALPVSIQAAASDIVAADKSEEAIEALVRPLMLRAVNAVAEMFGLERVSA